MGGEERKFRASESVVERRRNYHSFLGSFTRSLVPRSHVSGRANHDASRREEKDDDGGGGDGGIGRERERTWLVARTTFILINPRKKRVGQIFLIVRD